MVAMKKSNHMVSSVSSPAAAAAIRSSSQSNRKTGTGAITTAGSDLTKNKNMALPGSPSEASWSEESTARRDMDEEEGSVSGADEEDEKEQRKGAWSPEEDELLVSVLNKLKFNVKGGCSSSWSQVARHVKGRTAKQCRERWCYNLDPNIKKSKWTRDEDRTLMTMHNDLGNRWAQIAQALPGRTENSVKTRYKSLLRAKRREWTPAEDRTILSLHSNYGCRWGLIASSLKNRTKNAVKTRCRALMRGEADTVRLSDKLGIPLGSDDEDDAESVHELPLFADVIKGSTKKTEIEEVRSKSDQDSDADSDGSASPAPSSHAAAEVSPSPASSSDETVDLPTSTTNNNVTPKSLLETISVSVNSNSISKERPRRESTKRPRPTDPQTETPTATSSPVQTATVVASTKHESPSKARKKSTTSSPNAGPSAPIIKSPITAAAVAAVNAGNKMSSTMDQIDPSCIEAAQMLTNAKHRASLTWDAQQRQQQQHQQQQQLPLVKDEAMSHLTLPQPVEVPAADTHQMQPPNQHMLIQQLATHCTSELHLLFKIDQSAFWSVLRNVIQSSSSQLPPLQQQQQPQQQQQQRQASSPMLSPQFQSERLSDNLFIMRSPAPSSTVSASSSFDASAAPSEVISQTSSPSQTQPVSAAAMNTSVTAPAPQTVPIMKTGAPRFVHPQSANGNWAGMRQASVNSVSGNGHGDEELADWCAFMVNEFE
mmetsp:Transcript_7120/g.12643  ORF Transcript_7120/g.12643 Transcript_7120/m.12643 type:complete len:712 (+) Transcript_7120:663-2798(+)